MNSADLLTLSDYKAAYRSGGTTPARQVEEVYRRIRAYDDAAIFIALRPSEQVEADAQALEQRAPTESAALWRAGRDQGQYRRCRHSHHCRVPGLRVPAGRRCVGGCASEGGRGAHHRQDEPRSIRDGARGHPLALRRAAQPFFRGRRYPAEAVPARPLLSPPGSCRSRSGPIRPVRAASRRA